MRAVGYRESHKISDSSSLIDVELDEPVPTGLDLLVEVKAISVNPVDTKVRMASSPPSGEVKVLGWDASGVVVSVASDLSSFKVGDEVWYAGSIARAGTNSELHLVDERLVSLKPKSIDHASAAALPLTSITAWEILFDRLGVLPGKSAGGKSILIIGAAGGVGSILVQLCRRLTNLCVIGTASRPESKEWVRSMGAHFVIDHSKSLIEEIQSIGISNVDYIASLTQTGLHFKEFADLLVPQGKLALIDDPDPSLIDVGQLKAKSISLHWEMMFTRSLFNTHDMIAQQGILFEIAELIDKGLIRTTRTEHYGVINATNLKRAHASIEDGATIGKIVLAGF